MRIVTFASGSTGNCCLVSDGGVNVLIDAGISARRIVQGLGVLGLAPQDVCGVLITHEHSDHISGLPVLVKRTGMRIFAPSELGEVLKRVKPELSESIDYIPPDDNCVSHPARCLRKLRLQDRRQRGLCLCHRHGTHKRRAFGGASRRRHRSHRGKSR